MSKVTVNAVSLQSKTVSPSTSSQTVTPASGYLGLSKVTVNAIPSTYIDTSDATATAAKIARNETAYVNGSKITGTAYLAEFILITLYIRAGTSSMTQASYLNYSMSGGQLGAYSSHFDVTTSYIQKNIINMVKGASLTIGGRYGTKVVIDSISEDTEYLYDTIAQGMLMTKGTTKTFNTPHVTLFPKSSMTIYVTVA